MPDRYLLDTHALIWWWLGDPSLSDPVRIMLEERSATICVSAISAIEIGMKVKAGRLPVMAEPLADFDKAVRREGFGHLPVCFDHARRAGLLDGAHRDPFDRIIAAQGIIEGLTVVTKDREIASFGCEVIW